MNHWFKKIYFTRDYWWSAVLLGGLSIFWIWNALFLNAPALRLLARAFINSLFVSTSVTLFSLLFSLLWIWLEILSPERRFYPQFILTFTRSIPQLVGILLGYVLLTRLIHGAALSSHLAILGSMALIISLFITPEVIQLLNERIAHFKRNGFYNAMRCSGIKKSVIVFRDILWLNSRYHIVNKLIAVFGMTIFLQASVDFIISVGLTTRVTSLDLPVTLGRLLANVNSKQDILTIGYALSHPLYLPRLFYTHLQGISTAFLIGFLLFSLDRIHNSYAERHEL